MKKVKGIGGIFFKSKNSEDLTKWYKDNLGVPVIPAGCGVFSWREYEEPKNENATIWSVMPSDTDYLDKSKSEFMINYIVDSLDDFIKDLKSRGVQVEDKIVDCEQGRFAWGYDPDGNKFELWQPIEGKEK